MASDVRQYNFSNGEIAPLLQHRSDLDVYGGALRRCRNFIPTRHGALLSRPGTTIVRHVSSNSRFIPFMLGDDEAWLVEMIPGALMFHRDGQTLLNDNDMTSSPFFGTAKTVACNLGVRLDRVKHAQLGLVMVLSNTDRPPKELRQIGPKTFQVGDVTFDLPAYKGTEPVAVDPIPTGDGSHPAKEWEYGVSTVYRRPDGTKYETAVHWVTRRWLFNTDPEFNSSNPRSLTDSEPNTLPKKLVVYPDKPFELDFARIGNGLSIEDPDVYFSSRIYRRRGLLSGRVGEVLGPPTAGDDLGKRSDHDGDAAKRSRGATGGRFIDYGGDPDAGNPAPLGQNPFQVRNPATDAIERTEDPNAVAYFDGRLVFGGTTERPGFLWFSAHNSFRDFDERIFLVDVGSAVVALAGPHREEIRSLLALERLLIFTDGGVWALGDATVTGAGVNPVRLVSSIGSSWLTPIALPGGVLYVTRQGSQIRNLAYSEERGGYASGDMTFFAQHLFEGKTIVSWAYAENPWGVLWVVLSDGTLLSLTYAQDLGILGWARHDTDGIVKDVCVVPEGNEDAVYLVVERAVTSTGGTRETYLERMASRVVDDPVEAVCLDCSSFFPAGPYTTLVGLRQLRGRSDVWAVADGNLVGPLTVAANGDCALPEPMSNVRIGLLFTCEAETLDVAGDRFVGKKTTRALIDVERSRGFKIGTDENTLEEWSPRKVEDSWSAVPLFTGKVERYLKGRWAESGRVLLRQDRPFPLTITGITREIEGGSR